MQLVNRVIFQSDSLWIGKFRCPLHHPNFSCTGPIERGPIVVFPRTCVGIAHAGKEPVMADPNVVMLYNQGQAYRRLPLSDQGDHCDWFALAPQALTTMLESWEGAPRVSNDAPFSHSHVTCAPNIYLLQRLVVEHITRASRPDPLFIEEIGWFVAEQILLDGTGASSVVSTGSHAHRVLTEEARHWLAQHFCEQVTLEQIAAALYVSPYHLARVFRQQCGFTLHQYLHNLRVRSALEQIVDRAASLSELAVDLGYASHSHFTRTFRRTFGVLPSALKQHDARQLLEQVSAAA